MGACGSVSGGSAVDRFLMEEHKKEENIIKILLLGTGNSGKSTFMKQFRALTGKLNDLDLHKPAISGNVITATLALYRALQDKDGHEAKGHKFPSTLNRTRGLNILLQANQQATVWDSVKYPMGGAAFGGSAYSRGAEEWKRNQQQLQEEKSDEKFETVADVVEAIWEDPAMHEIAPFHDDYDTEIPIEYFIKRFDKIKQPDYSPTKDHVMRLRQRTTGVNSFMFEAMGTSMRIIDVGGQKNERKKWISQFDNCTVVLFLVSLIDYDLNMIEDSSTLRMADALHVFKDIVDCPYFENTDMVLFMNKMDLFEKKIRRVPITDTYPDFDGDTEDYEDCVAFFRDKFVDIFSNRHHAVAEGKNKYKQLSIFETIATDTENVAVVFESVKEMIRKLNLQAANILG